MQELEFGGHRVASAAITKSWGLNPGGGSMRLVGAGNVSTRDTVVLTLGAVSFHGRVRRVASGGDDGVIDVDVVDNRFRLREETVAGFWNREITIEDDPDTPGIDRGRRFEHMLVADWSNGKKTRSEEPMTAREILLDILSADSVDAPWDFEAHPLLANPVYNLDAEGGAELGATIQKLLDELQLLMTLDGGWTLRFARKGEGNVPPFPPVSYDRRLGTAINSGAPTKVRIIGAQNLIQDVADLEPAWNRRWEKYWLEPAWIAAVDKFFGPYGAGRAARADLASRARTVTVREFAERAQAEGDFTDRRLFGDVSRMEIPAWKYLHNIVYKCYGLKADYSLGTLHIPSLRIKEGLLAGMDYNTDTGALFYKAPIEPYPKEKAFMLAQGQPLEALEAYRHGGLDPGVLNRARDAWSPVSGYRVDPVQRMWYFDAIVVRPGVGAQGLFVFPSSTVADAPEQSKNLAVPNSLAVIEPAPVRASFVIAAERFEATKGNGDYCQVVREAALSQHQLLFDGELLGEVRYRNGKSAVEIAGEIADGVLDQSDEIADGGYKVPGSAGTILEGTIDRITVNFSPSGLNEDVTFTNARAAASYDSERELERRRKAKELFPGQQALEEEARQLRDLASLARGSVEPVEPFYRSGVDIGRRPVTSREVNPQIVHNPTEEIFLAGAVLFGDGENGIDHAAEEFLGVVVLDKVGGKDIPVARSGIVPVRVTGPVKVGDVVGADSGSTVAKAGGERPIGKLAISAAYDGSDTVLLPVQLGAGGDQRKTPFEYTVTLDAFGNPYVSFHPGVLKTPKAQAAPAIANPQAPAFSSYPFPVKLGGTLLSAVPAPQAPASKSTKNHCYLAATYAGRRCVVGDTTIDTDGDPGNGLGEVTGSRISFIPTISAGTVEDAGDPSHGHPFTGSNITLEAVSQVGDMHFAIDELYPVEILVLPDASNITFETPYARRFYLGWFELDADGVEIDSDWTTHENWVHDPQPYGISHNSHDTAANPSGIPS